MAKKRISEEQARKIVQEVTDGAKPADLAKKYGFSLGTYYNWRAKFGAPKPSASKAKPKAKAKKAAPKKRGRKPAAKKAAATTAAPAKAKKAAPKKRGPKPGGKKRGRKPAAKKVASAPSSAAAIKSRIMELKGQIKSAEAEIVTLKSAYADAVFG